MNGWNYWGATIAGPRHLAKGQPNQDAWDVQLLPWGEILIVSDGVGSCAHSAVGAQAACLAVKEAAEFCYRYQAWDSPHLAGVIQALWRALVFPLAPNDCAATCLFVMREEGGQAVVGMLGDGLAAARREDGAIELLVDEKEESFSNVTSTLANGAAAEWKFLRGAASTWSAFLLCTDGIADDLRPAARGSFVTDLLAHYRTGAAEDVEGDLRRWLEAWPVAGHSDDKTIACLHRVEEAHG